MSITHDKARDIFTQLVIRGSLLRESDPMTEEEVVAIRAYIARAERIEKAARQVKESCEAWREENGNWRTQHIIKFSEVEVLFDALES